MMIEKDMDLIRSLDDLIESTENKNRRSPDLIETDKIFIKELRAIREWVMKRRVNNELKRG